MGHDPDAEDVPSWVAQNEEILEQAEQERRESTKRSILGYEQRAVERGNYLELLHIDHMDAGGNCMKSPRILRVLAYFLLTGQPIPEKLVPVRNSVLDVGLRDVENLKARHEKLCDDAKRRAHEKLLRDEAAQKVREEMAKYDKEKG